MASINTDLELLFPNLKQEHYLVTSPITPKYNCIAWSTSNNTQWWEPGGIYFWPDGISQDWTIAGFVEMYGSLGYVECADGGFETGFEKIALYAESGMPTHAARQLSNGYWTSKLGKFVDIEHTLNGIVNNQYGSPVKFFKKNIIT